MSQSSDELSNWKKLISQLPYVINVQIVADESGNATDIHILAGEGRSPKQIMRDIQSAIMAKFQKEIDYKIISIAQIPVGNKPVEQNLRLRYDGLNISYSSKICSLKVDLEIDGKIYSGSDECELSRLYRYRAIAGATAQAVNNFLAEKSVVSIEDLKFVEIGGQSAVIVAVSFLYNNNKQFLIGSSMEDDENGPAAIKATLDAINRKISML